MPAGGIGEVVVGLVGEACYQDGSCERSDVIFPLTDDPLVTGVAPTAPAPAAATPIGTQLLPLVALGTAFAVIGALAALVLGRRRALGTDPAGH